MVARMRTLSECAEAGPRPARLASLRYRRAWLATSNAMKDAAGWSGFSVDARRGCRPGLQCGLPRARR